MSKAFDMNITTSVSIWLTSPKVFKVNELAASVANAKSQVMCPEIQVMGNVGDCNCKKSN